MNLLKPADDDEDVSTETEKMMKEVPGLKGAMLYARRRRIEKATADEVDEFIEKQKHTNQRRLRRDKDVASKAK